MSTRKQDPIKKITTSTGQVRYRFIIDMGPKPDKRRDQRCFTYDTLTEARAERSKIIADRSPGTLAAPTKVTVKEAIDKWLDGRRNLRPSTVRNYADSLRLVSDRLGHIPLQKVNKKHVEDLVTQLLDHGRRVGNIQHRGLSPPVRESDAHPVGQGAGGRGETGHAEPQRREAGGAPPPSKEGDEDLEGGTGRHVLGDGCRSPAERPHSSSPSTACVVVRSLACAGRMLIFRPRRSRSAEHESRSLVSGSWRGSLRPSVAVAPCRWMTALWPLYVP
jgi:hypothetical protein